MALTVTAKNLMLDYLGTLITHLSLHSGDPGTTGASEISGGTYARRPVTWGASSAGDLHASNAPLFNVPANTSVSHWGGWSALTAGTFYAGGSLSATEAFTAAGTYQITSTDVTLT